MTPRICDHCGRQKRIHARNLCNACYLQHMRHGRLRDYDSPFPPSGRPIDISKTSTCPACVAALRVEVSSAMRVNAFVPLCPHRNTRKGMAA